MHPYQMRVEPDAAAEDIGPIVPGRAEPSAVVWAERARQCFESVWGEVEEGEDRSSVLFLHPPANSVPGWDVHEIKGFRRSGEVLRQLLAFLLRSGRPSVLDPKYDLHVFASLAESERLAIAAAVALELGSSFEPLARSRRVGRG